MKPLSCFVLLSCATWQCIFFSVQFCNFYFCTLGQINECVRPCVKFHFIFPYQVERRPNVHYFDIWFIEFYSSLIYEKLNLKKCLLFLIFHLFFYFHHFTLSFLLSVLSIISYNLRQSAHQIHTNCVSLEGRGVVPGGGGGRSRPLPPMKILGGQTYHFAPPPPIISTTWKINNM